MKLPSLPILAPISRISPSIYSAARLCLARAAWLAQGDKSAIPEHPRSLLGMAVHYVLEVAGRGRTESGERAQNPLDLARADFDAKLGELFARAHPMLAAKFGSPDRLPYYNLYKERAASLAAELAEQRNSREKRPEAGSSGSSIPGPMRERAFSSNSGRLYGRVDLLNPEKREVVDYKTSKAPDDGGIRETEARQLRLYAHLVRANGVDVAIGVILRSDRTRSEMAIGEEEARFEAAEALAKLDEFNAKVGMPFLEAATPSMESCAFCPCIPICSAFWDNATPLWAKELGVHAEGIVEEVEVSEAGIVGIRLMVDRGTTARGMSHIERLTEVWLTVGSDTLPEKGDRIRVVGLYLVDEGGELAVYRADREKTSLWHVG
jgi:hypothetical protein